MSFPRLSKVFQNKLTWVAVSCPLGGHGSCEVHTGGGKETVSRWNVDRMARATKCNNNKKNYNICNCWGRAWYGLSL